MEAQTRSRSDKLRKFPARMLILFTLMNLLLVNSSTLMAQPIQRFDAVIINKCVRFNWELTQNFIYTLLEIERSADYQNFHVCIAMNGANYKHTAWDKLPLGGTSYYRLKVTDVNSNTFYSPVTKIINPGNISNFIDPGRGINNTTAPSTVSGGRMVITDLKGNILKQVVAPYQELPSVEELMKSIPERQHVILIQYRNGAIVSKQVWFKQ